ncbi:hypothetical protein EYB31_09560 [Paenibacillus thalictri]|uniref:Glycosyl transferase family 4 n=2 Tax=Paenibacillus thalictri TaxID=2527873 RepID=A0A4Q9DSH2_9BACL|nr:hypothetical protein EYB31_09560 [Paenibacillus thalictri]
MLTASLGWLLAAFVLSVGLRKSLLVFLRQNNVTADNYAGRAIPTAAGLYVGAVVLAYAFIWSGLHYAEIRWMRTSPFTIGLHLDTIYLFALTAVLVAGLLDDLAGDKAVKGILGHWRTWRKEGRLTTGLVKAIVISAAASIVTWASERPLAECAAGCLLIALMSNALNLLDLRPGRALKLFLPAALLLVGAATLPLFVTAMAPVIAAAAVLFPEDVRGEAMLGDAGANTLGFALGVWLFQTAGFLPQLAVLAVLAALHIWSCKHSLTARIERSPLLRWIDRLGRDT